jgi:hypothetical protein
VSDTITKITWDIRRGGRAWGDEAMDRYFSMPEKTEMVEGRLFNSAEEREHMLCLLLENVGVDRAVQFGDPSVWRAAIARLKE